MLERKKTTIGEQRSSKKEPLTDEDAARLLAGATTVKIAKGKAITEKPAREATLDDLKGPTGGYRAPIIAKGRVLLVGFHAETLEGLL